MSHEPSGSHAASEPSSGRRVGWWSTVVEKLRGLRAVYGWLSWPYLAGMGVCVCFPFLLASGWASGAALWQLLGLPVLASLAIWFSMLLGQGYRRVTIAEYQQLRAGGVTHRTSAASAELIAAGGGVLRLDQASRWTILLVNRPLRVYRRAVFVFPASAPTPSREVLAFNVRVGDNAVELLIQGTALPSRDRVFIRDRDGAIAITDDLSARIRLGP